MNIIYPTRWMELRIVVLGAALVLVTAGCASLPTSPSQPYGPDRVACMDANHWYDPVWRIVEEMTTCMAARGWVPEKGPLPELSPTPYLWRWRRAADATR